MEYSVTLEHGTDGTTIAWVEELPGLAVRGPSRDDVLPRLPAAIEEFARWAGVATELTLAHWSGAPRPEPWTARKAARRLVWHELLHLRALRR